MNESNYYTIEELECIRGEKDFPTRHITPSVVNVLDKSEVFVFGSNVYGHHAGGAARAALRKYGAIWGQGEGLQGQSYAIPTMEGIDNMKSAIERFVSFAKQHQELKFLVTAIGCGIAGYRPDEVAPFFKEVTNRENVYLPLPFWKVLFPKG